MKITASNSIKDLDSFIGKPCILKYILNDSHEIEVRMPIDWKMNDLPYVLKESFIEPPRTVHIVSLAIDLACVN